MIVLLSLRKSSLTLEVTCHKGAACVTKLIEHFRFNPPDIHVLASCLSYTDASTQEGKDLMINVANHKSDVSRGQCKT